MLTLLDRLFAVLGKMPSVNFRTFVGEMLAIVFVIVLTVGMVIGCKIDHETAGIIATFLLGMMGLSVAAYHSKRTTFQPDPPSAPDAEDVAATQQAAPGGEH